MEYNAVARISAVWTLLLSIPVIIWDYWISPAALAETHLTLFYILLSLYLLWGVAFAVFAYGFADLGRKHLSKALVIASTALAACYLISAAVAALLPVLPGLFVLDVPLILGRGICELATGTALLNVRNSQNALYVLVGCIFLLDGGFVLLQIVQLSLQDFSAIALLLCGYMLFKREA